jgi:hypothetical protein
MQLKERAASLAPRRLHSRPSSTPELAIFALIIALWFQRRRLESCKTQGARKNSVFFLTHQGKQRFKARPRTKAAKEETFCPNAKLWDWLCFCHYLSFIFLRPPSLYPFPLRAVLASYKNFPIKFWAELFLRPPVCFIQSPPLNSTIGGNHTYKQLKVLVLTET